VGVPANVGLASKAEVKAFNINFRFTPKSGHWTRRTGCCLRVNSETESSRQMWRPRISKQPLDALFCFAPVRRIAVAVVESRVAALANKSITIRKISNPSGAFRRQAFVDHPPHHTSSNMQ
jgi:hypothetical protein